MFQNRNTLLVLPMMTALIIAAWDDTQAHTRFEINTTKEGVRVDNNIMIGHLCTNEPVIGQVTVFPDVTTALVDTSPDSNAALPAETFTRSDQPATAFIQGLTIAGIMNRDTFSMSALIRDGTGNPIGVWSAGGSIPDHNWVAKMPVRINPINIVADSCAKKVIIAPAIANVCQVTSLNEIDGKNPDRTDVDFWTAPDSGHPKFDAPGWNFPAPFTVNRDLETNPLPSSCGEGIAVRIYPSAAQLDRDFPVVVDGQQVWPAP
ncbi:hypothetical protein SAMN05421880_10456 [Nitrosomonas nitrosa]|uniref:Uncharacterized protein n=2 Tax=Nitrosomonas nitrosa TaxID=52442 RepID=A0A1I4MFP7_9PROT|nr:hypothetical protein SAMN05421880_10456 [Nitrosomonas nitrosa]